MRSKVRAVAALGIFVGILAAPSASRAGDEVGACVKASEQAQSLRDEGKYMRARDQLLVCTRDVCPGVVRKDCVQWLSEIDASMPSVVISAKDGSGHDLIDVKVTLDGAPFATKLDGKPLPIDPGEHAVRYEAAGAPPVDDKVVVHAGEKNRTLSVKLGAEPAKVAAKPTEPAADQGSKSSGPPIAALVLGGVGVLALGSFAFFGITGKGDVSDLRGSCAGHCAQSDVDAAKSKLLIADISLGIGVVALGVATYLFVTNKSSPATVTTGLSHVDVQPLPGGGVAQVGGRF